MPKAAVKNKPRIKEEVRTYEYTEIKFTNGFTLYTAPDYVNEDFIERVRAEHGEIAAQLTGTIKAKGGNKQ